MVKTKAKRLLSLLLAFAMVMSLTVTPVYAADDEDTSDGTEASETGGTSSTSAGTFSEPEAAEDDEEELTVYEDPNAGIAMIDENDSNSTNPFPEADSDGVITLTADVELTEQYVVSESTTIDLNGHTITRANGSNFSYLFSVGSGVTLTIKDSGSNGQIINTNFTVTETDDDGKETEKTYAGNDILVNGGTVTIESGTVSGYRAIYGSTGTVNVNGGTVSGSYIGIMDAGSLNVNISSGSVSGYHSGVYMQGGTVNVTGGTISARFAINMQAGTVKVSGSAAVSTSGSFANGWTYGIYLGAGASATIEDSAKITATNAGESGASAGIVYFGNSDSENPTTVVIKGGEISGETYGLSGNGSASYSEVTVSDGKISSDFIAIYHPEMGTITISGGEITGVYAGVQLIAGKLEVTGGTITATATADEVSANANSVANKTGDGAIADGAAISIINRSGYGKTQSDSSAETSYDSVTVSGGTVISASGVSAVNAYTYSNNTSTALTTNVSVTGGTYSTDVSDYTTKTSSSVATTTTDEDGNTSTVYTVVETVENAVAAAYNADGTLAGTYSALDEAYKATPDGGRLVLLADISAPASGNTLSIYRAWTITLDLNGHQLAGQSIAIFVSAAANMTIQDSAGGGKVTGAGGSGLVRATAGTVTIENGTYEATSGNVLKTSDSSAKIIVNGGTFTSTSSDVINNGGGAVVINDGTFTASASGKTIIGLSATTEDVSVKIYGGTFSGPISYNYEGIGYEEDTEIPNAGDIVISGGTYYGTSDWLLNSYLADGYAATSGTDENGTAYYTVGPMTAVLTYTSDGTTVTKGCASVQAAVNAVAELTDASGIKITMYDNCDSRVTITSGTFTLDLNGYTITSDTSDGIALLVSGGTVTVTDGSEAQTGTVTTVDSYSNGSALVRVTSGSVILAGGHYKPGSSQGTIGVSQGADLTITGGYFTSDPSGYTGNCEVAKSTDESATYKYYVADVIVGRNIDLASGVITMNVYIAGELEDGTNSVTLSPAATESTYKVSAYTGSDVDAEYVLSENVEPKKMSVEWTVTVTLSNGYVVTYNTSVTKYAKAVIEANTDANAVAVLKAMLDYGSAVQTATGYVTENSELANGGTYYNETDLSNATADAMKNAGAKKTTNYSGWTSTTTPVTFTSMNMVMDYDFDIIMTYSADLSSYADNVTVTIGGTTYNNVTVNGKTITISGLTAVQLTKVFVVTVSDGTNSYATKVSGLYYARLLANNSDSTTVRLGQALYLYCTKVAGLTSEVNSYVEG